MDEPIWTVQSRQEEWTDGLIWHSHSTVLVSPEGHETNLEEAAILLNIYERQLKQYQKRNPDLISG